MSQTFPPVRLAALDLDGTLLSGHSEVTPRTRQALARAAANGVVIVPATGRPLASLPPIVATLPGVRYALTSNGAAVWDLHNDPLGAVYSRYANAAEHETSEPEAVLHDLMPVETAREVFALCEACHADLRIFADGRAMTDRASMEYNAACHARKGSTEARQPDDGRFTYRAGLCRVDEPPRPRGGKACVCLFRRPGPCFFLRCPGSAPFRAWKWCRAPRRTSR